MSEAKNDDAIYKVAETLAKTRLTEAAKQFDDMFKSNVFRQRFGQNISVMRNLRCLSMTQFAKKVGCDHAHLSRVEAGKANISFSLAVTICQNLDVSLKLLLTHELRTLCEHAIEMADKEASMKEK